MVSQVKEKIHHTVIRESRRPTLLNVKDIFPSVFDTPAILVYGSQSSLGDYSPYYVAYKDMRNIFHILKFSQVALSHVSTCDSPDEVLNRIYHFSLADLAVANTALKMYGVSPMSLKCMVSTLHGTS